MDNSYILLLILKKGINVANFLDWITEYQILNMDVPKWNDYCNYHGILSSKKLEEFEFNYFVSYLRLRNFI